MKSLVPVLLLCAASLAGAASPPRATVGIDAASKIRARVLELVNVSRAAPRRCGKQQFPAAPPLKASDALRTAAQRHADDMARGNYFDHQGKDGSHPRDRVLDAGYRFRLTGENIAFGPDSAEEVMQGWLASPGHCASIMDARFTELGVAFATGDKRERIYWVQEFGQPRPAR